MYKVVDAEPFEASSIKLFVLLAPTNKPPVEYILPATDNFWPGAVVPIPTLPSLSIFILIVYVNGASGPPELLGVVEKVKAPVALSFRLNKVEYPFPTYFQPEE